MNKIICATRAGEGSRVVQLAAIERANGNSQGLVFLYVVDSSIYETLDELIRPFVRVELYWLAKTILRIAENRAQAAGIIPELVIREGRVHEEISKYVASVDTSCLLLGAPRRRRLNIFDEDAIDSFARSIQQASGVNVLIVRPAARTPSIQSDSSPDFIPES